MLLLQIGENVQILNVQVGRNTALLASGALIERACVVMCGWVCSGADVPTPLHGAVHRGTVFHCPFAVFRCLSVSFHRLSPPFTAVLLQEGGYAGWHNDRGYVNKCGCNC